MKALLDGPILGKENDNTTNLTTTNLTTTTKNDKEDALFGDDDDGHWLQQVAQMADELQSIKSKMPQSTYKTPLLPAAAPSQSHHHGPVTINVHSAVDTCAPADVPSMVPTPRRNIQWSMPKRPFSLIEANDDAPIGTLNSLPKKPKTTPEVDQWLRSIGIDVGSL